MNGVVEMSRTMLYMGVAFGTFMVAMLFAMQRKREGIPAKRFGWLRDFSYAMLCCPCAISWIMRTEMGASLNGAREWSLLSPIGVDDGVEVWTTV